MNKPILDPCCGSKMFWFDKSNPDVLFADHQIKSTALCDGRRLDVQPDIIADFRDLPFEDERFWHVVFDPPHLVRAGEKSWLRAKYGVLPEDWKDYISKGFAECFRVLKPHGTLVFKWNEDQIKVKEILALTDKKPLYGNQRSGNGKTHWIVFYKNDKEE